MALALSSSLAGGCARPSNYSLLEGKSPMAHLKDIPKSKPGEALFIGAGDIAWCDKNIPNKHSAHEKTAQLIETYPKDTPVFTLGDNAYHDGSLSDYQGCYNRSWGRFKDRTYPVSGNHEYRTKDAAGYFSYFGKRAGDKPYYSFDLEKWHVLVLDSECQGGAMNGLCLEKDSQMQWLRKNLEAHSNKCTLALWHRPRVSTGKHGPALQIKFLFDLLVDKGVDLAVTGHDHHYERFAPIDKHTEIDHRNGIRHFVVGTGGAPLRGERIKGDTSEFKTTKHHGIIELHLKQDSYAWRFIAIDGQVIDSGIGNCH